MLRLMHSQKMQHAPPPSQTCSSDRKNWYGSVRIRCAAKFSPVRPHTGLRLEVASGHQHAVALDCCFQRVQLPATRLACRTVQAHNVQSSEKRRSHHQRRRLRQLHACHPPHSPQLPISSLRRFIILSGVVAVLHPIAGSKISDVSPTRNFSLSAGATFGDAALRDHAKRSSTCCAETDVELLVVPKEAYVPT